MNLYYLLTYSLFFWVFELALFFSSVMTWCSFEMCSTRNDLWALGCTLYQMLSGTSPFKDASEWLIFQRIIARDIRFPNYFSEAARDLIDKLLARNELTKSYVICSLSRTYFWTSCFTNSNWNSAFFALYVN